MAFVLKYFTREADFDVYLEGTPATKGKLHPEKLFPYDYHPIRPSKDEALQGNDASQAYRDAQALERRRNPSCIEEACAYGNLPAVILMWSQGVVDISTRHALYEGSDATPLMWAALRGHLPIVRFLVDMKADVNATNSLGHTALHWVLCGSQCLEVARFLLDHGADPAQKDKQGNDAAFHAVQNRQLALLAVLLADNPNNNVFNGHNLPSVSGLASVQHLPSYRYRLDTASVDVGGRTLLHWAAYNNSMAMCEFLIEYFGFDVNAVDGVGRTPLLWAAREGFAEVMEYLLSRGADVSVRDNDGIVAKQYARTRNHPDALYVLEKFPPSAVVGSSHNPTENLNQGGDVPQSPRRMDNRGYKSVRQVRLLGTIGMMRHSRLFAFFACAAPVYFLFSYELVRFLSPIVACVLFFSYFFKNVAWTFAVGWPSQGSSSRPKMGGIEITGLATGFRESVCGPWWSRGREAANLFALLSVLFIEVYAWGQAGFTHLVFTPQNPHLTDFLTKPSTTPEGLANPQNYLFGSVLAPFFGSPESMVRGVLLFLLGCILVNVLLFKLTFMRSLIKPQSEGTLRTAPLWRILHHRKYKWLHPRIYSQERHFQIPVRTFHCPHYDAYVQGYDSYSALLDAPIGGSNHRYFVLFLISFLLFQFLFFMWGLNEISVMLQCSSATRCGEWQWYSNALLPFRSRDALKELVERPPTGAPQSTSVVSFSWLSLFMQLWFHGVPNSPYPHNVELVKTYLKEGNLISWAKFIWKYYCVPTHLSSMGVWIFQISFLAFGCAFYMIVRHMGAIIYGCTCIEYANPFAPGSEGDMVLIFPPNMNTATTFVCGENEQEEKYFLAVDPAKSQLNKTVQMGRRCIYGSRFALVNTLRFFLGRHAVEWRNAMTVSNTNTPSRVPLLSA